MAHRCTDCKNNPLQQFSQGQPEGQGPQQQPRHLGHTDISTADSEPQVNPGVPDRRHKQPVAVGGMLGPQGAEQLIHHPQAHSHQQGGGKLPGGDYHRRHLNRRLAKLPRWRGSS